jgi:predicted ATP-dependent serine protease
MTSRPRLDAAGADASRVALLDAVVNENGEADTFSLPKDLDGLKAAIEEMGDVVLIVIDPITSYMGSQLDSHKVTEVRAVLEPLGRFAEDHNVVIIMVTHPTKAAQEKSINPGFPR